MKDEIEKKRLSKRHTLSLLSAASLGALSGIFPSASYARDKEQAITPGVLRIGYQKYGTLTLLKASGALDKRLAAANVTIRWAEFPAGPQLLEALNVGSLDFGTTGEAPPIFAQAAGADLVYVGTEPPAPASEAIVVAQQSPIQSVSGLKGKKIALNKGSNVHYLLVKALEKSGLTYQDVNVIYLPPADARAAFERGSVDAWAIWDPFLAAAETQLRARILIDGKGLVSNHQFYLAARKHAQQNPEIVRIVLDELNKLDLWNRSNTKEVGLSLAKEIGLDPAVAGLSARRLSFGVLPIDEKIISEQQNIADTFADLKLIPKKIQIRDATLHSNV
jgi:sulfonate transport system substrate-binding protein